MAFKAGTTSAFYLASKAGTVTNLSPYADSVEVPQTVSTLEVSVLGTAAKAFITGLTDGDDISLGGPYDSVSWTLLTDLKAAQAVGSAAAAYIWGPGGSVASQARSAGTVWVKSIGTGTSVGGVATLSATLQVTGAVVNGSF